MPGFGLVNARRPRLLRRLLHRRKEWNEPLDGCVSDRRCLVRNERVHREKRLHLKRPTFLLRIRAGAVLVAAQREADERKAEKSDGLKREISSHHQRFCHWKIELPVGSSCPRQASSRLFV